MTQEEHSDSSLKSLRTFQGDVEETIHTKHESVVSVVAKEQERKPVGTITPHSSAPKTILVFIISLILLSCGGGIVWFIQKTTEQKRLEQQTLRIRNIIVPQQTKDVVVTTLDRGTFISTIKEIKNTTLEPKTIYGVQFLYNTTPVPSADLMSILASRASGALHRTFTDAYTLGVYAGKTNDFFIIAHIDNFGIAYKEMLSWEPSMIADLRDFFTDLHDATFTKETYTFTDDTYKNKDVRVLVDDNRKTVLVYGFIEKDILLIAPNEEVFSQLLSEYIQSKLSR